MTNLLVFPKILFVFFSCAFLTEASCTRKGFYTPTPPKKKKVWTRNVVKKPNQNMLNAISNIWTHRIWPTVCALSNCYSACCTLSHQKSKSSFAKCNIQHMDKQHSTDSMRTKELFLSLTCTFS